MKSHISIKVAGVPMVLPDDFSISVSEENPVFHDVGMHSDPVEVPMIDNRMIFQNIDDPKSAVRPVSLEHLPAEIYVRGLPFRTGTVVIQEDEELKDHFAFNIDESTQSFENLIGDLKCRDVPLYNNERIPIGQKISGVEVGIRADVTVDVVPQNIPGVFHNTKEISASATFEPQALGFSYPGVAAAGTKEKSYPNGVTIKVPNVSKSYINVSEPYLSVNGKPADSGWRYCNARICYAHRGLDETKAVADIYESGVLSKAGTIGETTDEVMKVGDNYSVNEDYGPYWVLDADRPQSGLCFYVLYFLDCLFHYLGVSFDNSALIDIEDMRRLCFFTTGCKYIVDETETIQSFGTLAALNKWLEDRGCGGRIEITNSEQPKSLGRCSIDWGHGIKWDFYTKGNEFAGGMPAKKIEATAKITWQSVHSKVRTMYATPENFPDVTVKSLIESLENSFGIRFDYDYQNKKVRAYLLRDVFRQIGKTPIQLPCTLLDINKIAEKITGVSMRYSAESERDEQASNVNQEKRDYDTDFDYIDYRQGRTKVSDGYMSIANDLRTENVTCYVDLNTANAYRFKISKDLDTADVAYHRLFEVGQFKGVEEGNCSKANEDFVVELVSDFQPMGFNDVNAYAELKQGATQSLLAAFVDDDMEHEFVTQKINIPVYNDLVDIYATEVLRLVESYDPSKTDDGNSPLQNIDWGLAVAVMRGGGTNAEVQNYDFGYDGFDNAKWRTVAGSYAMASDTMDQFGNTFDYNGTLDGDGGGERFSLKIRAYKPFLFYHDGGKTHITKDLSLKGKPVEGKGDKLWLVPSKEDESIMRRGLADKFMSEYIWFLLNRQKLRIHCLIEPSVLMNIRHHWDNLFVIGDLMGFIDKVNYDLNVVNGIGEATLDFFAV